MSPRRDDPAEEEPEEDRPTSIFSTTWFRLVLVLVVLGIVAVFAVPYVLEVISPPPKPPAIVKMQPPAPPAQKKEEAPAAVAPSAAAPSRPPSTPPAAPKTQAPAPPPPIPAELQKPAAPKSEAPKQEAKAPSAPKPATAKAPLAAGGKYWVQVGAFKDPETAKRLAAKLREQNFSVAEPVKGGGVPTASAATTGAPAEGNDRYEVFVSGASAAALAAKLTGKGLQVESVTGGALVKPSMPLPDAVALSKDLAAEGHKVQVRRATARRPAAGTPPPTGGDKLYRVRVGAFDSRAAAVTALRDLEAKGYTPFIARERE
ncbi:MAG: SPOR domain-containing protein [Candidatus Rokubacteria bacterium]|nr:SPOR domain-containing protein [Candidatus Rokubacteria bacterium]